MPIYEYKCLKCETHFEKLQKISDAPLKSCESCGGELEKQWSLSGFQFKGEGWYVTDYAKDKNGKPEKTDDGEKKVKSESTEKPKSASKKESSTSSSKKDKVSEKK